MKNFIKYKHQDEIRLIHRALNELVKSKSFVKELNQENLTSLIHQVQTENSLQISDIYTKELEALVIDSKLIPKYLKLVDIKDLESELDFRDNILVEYLEHVSNMTGLDSYGNPIIKTNKKRLFYWLDHLLKNGDDRDAFHHIKNSIIINSLPETITSYAQIKGLFESEPLSRNAIALASQWGIAKVRGEHAFSEQKNVGDLFLDELEKSEKSHLNLLYYAIINKQDLYKAFKEDKLNIVYKLLDNE